MHGTASWVYAHVGQCQPHPRSRDAKALDRSEPSPPEIRPHTISLIEEPDLVPVSRTPE